MSEASALLKHPDPRERKLALRLDGITPNEIAIAILDPDEAVADAAFGHEHASHALDALSNNTRDAAGNFIWHRHDKLLNDPRCHKGHLEAMRRAVANDSYVSIPERANLIRRLKTHPMALPELNKREGNFGHELIYNNSSQEHLSKYHEEPAAHPELLEHYNQHINSSKPLLPKDADLHNEGMYPKVVYKTPTSTFIVKPYSEKENPRSGWNEATSQEIYKAAKVPHIHQKSFVGMHGQSHKQEVPVTVISAESASPVHLVNHDELLKHNPVVKNQARQIAVLDFLTANRDRTSQNLMVNKGNHDLLAIDHANSFLYGQEFNPDRYYEDSLSKFAHRAPGQINPYDTKQYQDTIKEWWPQVSKDVEQAFEQRLNLIKSNPIKEHLKQGFQARKAWLDRAANGGVDLDSEFRKSLGGAEFLHNQHTAFPEHKGLEANTTGLHEKLMTMHPASIHPGVQHFENHINKSPTQFLPHKKQNELGGVQEKAVYRHGGKEYLVKPTHENSTALDGFNEMVSQAAYHAGGIGHLHQKVHVTHGNTGLNRSEPAHALAVHIEPNSLTLADALGGTDADTGEKIAPKDYERARKTVTNPKHAESLRKIGLMDAFLSNFDRHSSNLVLKPDGSPVAIDSSRSLYSDRKHAMAEEVKGELGVNGDNSEVTTNPDYQHRFLPDWNAWAQHNDAIHYGGAPTDETWKWWHANKEPMLNKVKEYVDMLPDKAVGRKMMNSVMSRYNYINGMSKMSGQKPGLNVPLAYQTTNPNLPDQTVKENR